jgi:DNA replication protein DnaC
VKTEEMLRSLQLVYPLENLDDLAARAAREGWSHRRFLDLLLEGECQRRDTNGVARRIKEARFPLRKDLDGFDWNWPRKANRAQVQELFRLAFLGERANVVFVGGVGVGKTHLATALGRHACERGHRVLFATAAEIVNNLAAAQAAQRLRAELARYLRPALLIVDELGYLPVDKFGAELLFQVISQRYERNSTVFTTNKAFKHWAEIFNNDAAIASAVLDRVLHHAETVVIEGKSYRMRDRIADL